MGERIRSLPLDAGTEKAMEIVVEHTRNKQPASDTVQEFLEARHARQKVWREQQRRLLEVAIRLASSISEAPPDAEEPWVRLPPQGTELVAHLEAALAMLRDEVARHRNGRTAMWLLRSDTVQTPPKLDPKPIGLFFERGWNLHLHAIHTRCEEILLEQPPELRAEVQAVYECLSRFRLCRATEPWTGHPEPEAPTSREQIMAGVERSFAEMDRQSEEWEARQLALLTAALEQARRFAAATRGN